MMSETKEQALRYNEGKLRWSLVDFKSLEDMVKVLEMGAIKYSEDNWKKGLPTKEILDSTMRHLVSLMNGEFNDKESSLPHIGHLQANLMFLSYMMREKPEFNNIKFKEDE